MSRGPEVEHSGYRSRYPAPTVPEVPLPAYVLEHAARFGDRPALVDGTTGEAVAYRDLAPRVAAAAERCRQLGAGPGTSVALVAVNQPSWAVALYGVLATGAAVVPLNPTYTARELGQLLASSRAAIAVVDDRAHAAVAAAAAAAAPPDGPVLVELSDLARPSGTTGTALPDGRGGPRAPAGPADPADLSDPADPADGSGSGPSAEAARTAVIAFSSGTTGLPKGVQLSHRNLVATLVQHEGIYHMGQEDTVVAALPLFHIYGLSMVLGYALRHGATVVTLPRFRLDDYLRAIAEHRATWLHLAPPLALQLLSAEAATADLSSVRHAVSGAAPLDPGVAGRLEERLGCLVGQGYGMTEASPGVTWVPDDGSVACPPGSVGVLVAGTEARLVDPSTGTDAVAGTGDPSASGELWVRGPQVMSGYLDAPSETAATLVEGGWLRTGDLVRADADGVWWVVDRLKELIKYKGYQVAPAELEGLLLEHPAIADAAVAGRTDPVAGEVPVAWVVATRPLPEAELLAWVAERVAPYKRIRSARFVDAIPRSPAGKVLRRMLVEAARPSSAATGAEGASRTGPRRGAPGAGGDVR